MGDLIECRAEGAVRALLVCEKVELDKDAKKINPYHATLKMAVLYAGDERYTLFENDLNKDGGVCRVWEGETLKKRLEDLEVD